MASKSPQKGKPTARSGPPADTSKCPLKLKGKSVNRSSDKLVQQRQSERLDNIAGKQMHLRREINVLQKTLKTLNDDKEKLATSLHLNENLSELIALLDGRIENLNTNTAAQSQAITEFRKKHGNLTNTIESYEKKIIEMTQKLQETTTELAEEKATNGKNLARESHIDELKREAQNQQASINILEQKVRDLMEQSKSKDETNEILKAEIETNRKEREEFGLKIMDTFKDALQDVRKEMAEERTKKENEDNERHNEVLQVIQGLKQDQKVIQEKQEKVLSEVQQFSSTTRQPVPPVGNVNKNNRPPPLQKRPRWKETGKK